MDNILEPVEVNNPESAKILIKTLYSHEVMLVRNGYRPSVIDSKEIAEIEKAIAEHPEWNNYEVASWVIDNEEE